MGDSPEAIRERVKAEELAKGVDPRVAEGRAKAAELRAKQGLPIDPQEAWRAKLEQEGGAAAPAPAEPEAPAAAEPAPVEPEAPAPDEPEAPAPDEPEQAAPAAEPVRAPAAVPPSGAGEAETAAAVQAAPAPTTRPAAAPAPAPPPAAEPEIGRPVEVSVEGLDVIAGIPVRDNPLPLWLLAVLLVITAWALSYLIFFAGGNLENASQCNVQADHTFVCFQSGEEAQSGAASHQPALREPAAVE